MNEIIQKLNFSDYVFEFDEKDITDCFVKYSISEITSVHYADGRVEDVYNPVINLEIFGVDSDKNESFISFELNIGLKELNNYSDKPVNIIDKVSNSEAFMKKSINEHSEFLNFEIPTNTVNDIYKNLSSIWVSKLDNNKFIFKICIPSERIFSYFIINFDKNNEG